MVYKSRPASEYAIWACFQTALPFPEENNGKKSQFLGNRDFSHLNAYL